MILKSDLLDSWLSNDLNVLIEGAHGVGKTEQVLDCMRRNKRKYVYFSASTMDPYLDFVGIPRVVEDDKGTRYLDFIRRKIFETDDIEVIVIDELNRAPKKVRNAIMEIIQFKTINGEPLSKVKCVWAMINPPDENDTYDVDKLDPAQRDRFQVQVAVTGGPQKNYFESKYGQLGKIACEWWDNLPNDPKIRGSVTPRRLEYVIQGFKSNLDITHFLPKNVNVAQLKTELNKAGLYGRLPELKALLPDIPKFTAAIKGNGNLRDLVMSEIVSGKFPTDAIPAFSDEEIVKSAGQKLVARAIVSGVERHDQRFVDMARNLSATPASSVTDASMRSAITQVAAALTKYESEVAAGATAAAREAAKASDALRNNLVHQLYRQEEFNEDVLRKLLTDNKAAIMADDRTLKLISMARSKNPQASKVIAEVLGKF